MATEYSLAARGLSETGTKEYDSWDALRSDAGDHLDAGDQCTVYRLLEGEPFATGAPLYHGAVVGLPADAPT